MVHISEIEARLSQLGIKVSRWFSAEIRELQHVLVDNEKIIAAVPGRYFGGYALLVATDQRLLLIDKRTFFLTLEDIRYDMISQIDFNAQMFAATLQIYTVNKQHRFTTSRYRKQLRSMTVFVQQQILSMRQIYQENGGAPGFQRAMGQSYSAPSPPLREVYPSRAVAPSHPHMRFAPPVRNFKKIGQAALTGVHKIHAPHVHLPSMPQPEAGIAPSYYQ